MVYAKRPFAGPAAVLAYLSRYTHRVAISNSRLLAFDERGVTFRYKDYRAKGKTRYKAMTLSADEFIRRFLLHVLPSGFHRIRHYGLLANAGRREHLAQARELLQVPLAVKATSTQQASTATAGDLRLPALRCGYARRGRVGSRAVDSGTTTVASCSMTIAPLTAFHRHLAIADGCAVRSLDIARSRQGLPKSRCDPTDCRHRHNVSAPLDASIGAAIALPNIQIPIAFAAAAKYAAVSSFGACATPARDRRISAHACA